MKKTTVKKVIVKKENKINLILKDNIHKNENKLTGVSQRLPQKTNQSIENFLTKKTISEENKENDYSSEDFKKSSLNNNIPKISLKENTLKEKNEEEKERNNENNNKNTSLIEILKASSDKNKLENNEEFQKDIQDWADLDAEDANDPSMVSEYVNEIFDYMRELEVSS